MTENEKTDSGGGVKKAPHPKTRLSPLAYGILKKYADRGLEFSAQSSFLLAVSGGRDSVALFPLFRELQDRVGLRVHVGYVDHGPADDEVLSNYRRQALSSVDELSRRYAWPFLTNLAAEAPEGSDEAALRRFRQSWLSRWRDETESDFIVLAHHADDLLETRLIRLLRGTGPQGLEAMSWRDGFYLRPFLELPRSEVLAYAEANGLQGLEDPSNADERFLRNWLRKKILPQIEAYRPGSLRTLSRSLSQLAAGTKVSESALGQGILDSATVVISRRELTGASRENIQDILYRAVSCTRMLNLSASQLAEAAKRLDTRRKSLRFQAGPYLWTANAEQVTVEPLTADF